MLLEESERELAESKANVTRLQAELQASIRLQEETEKVSKLPRFSRNQERVEVLKAAFADEDAV